MKETIMNPQTKTVPNENASATSFHKISMGITLLVIVAAAAYYFLQVGELMRSSDAWKASVSLPAGYWQIAITTVVLIIVAEVIPHIVLAALSGQAPKSADVAQNVVVRAKSNAYTVLAFGAIGTVGAMFVTSSPFVMGNLLLLFFVLAEVTRWGTELYYASR